VDIGVLAYSRPYAAGEIWLRDRQLAGEGSDEFRSVSEITPALRKEETGANASAPFKSDRTSYGRLSSAMANLFALGPVAGTVIQLAEWGLRPRGPVAANLFELGPISGAVIPPVVWGRWTQGASTTPAVGIGLCSCPT